jgi:small-conductance mechanosensitive channel
MDRVFEFIQNLTGFGAEDQARLLQSVVIVLLLGAVRWSIHRVLRRKVDDVSQRYYWTRITTYTIAVVGILMVARVWFQGIGSVIEYLGIVSAGLVIAMHEAVANLAGWGFILSRRPFQVGDRIQIGENAGDVIDIRLFQFSVLEIRNWVDADQSTGRILHIPNGKVFRETLANFTRGFNFVWHEIPVLVTFESNWQKAEQILKGIVDEHVAELSADAERQIRRAAEKFMIYYGKLTPIIYLAVVDSGVQLTIRYMVDPRRRRGSEEGIWRAILEGFGEHDDIEFAYPTVRYYDHGREGDRGGAGTGRL